MKYLIFLICLVCFSFSSYSQLDLKEKTNFQLRELVLNYFEKLSSKDLNKKWEIKKSSDFILIYNVQDTCFYFNQNKKNSWNFYLYSQRVFGYSKKNCLNSLYNSNISFLDSQDLGIMLSQTRFTTFNLSLLTKLLMNSLKEHIINSNFSQALLDQYCEISGFALLQERIVLISLLEVFQQSISQKI